MEWAKIFEFYIRIAIILMFVSSIALYNNYYLSGYWDGMKYMYQYTFGYVPIPNITSPVSLFQPEKPDFSKIRRGLSSPPYEPQYDINQDYKGWGEYKDGKY